MKHEHNQQETHTVKIITMRLNDTLYIIADHFKANGLYNGMKILHRIKCAS